MRALLALAALLIAAPFAAAPASAQPADACGAQRWRAYVGRPVAALQRRVPEGPRARYVCSSCGMTADHREDRLTVVFDDRTRRIRRLSCT